MKNEKAQIITLKGENGKELDFILEATIDYDDEVYAILVPAQKFDDLEGDEAFIFRMIDDGDSQSFEMEHDETICQEIIDIYNSDIEENN